MNSINESHSGLISPINQQQHIIEVEEYIQNDNLSPNEKYF